MGIPPSGRLARFYWETFHLYLVLQHAWRRSLGEISHLTMMMMMMMMKACNVRVCVHAVRACSLRLKKKKKKDAEDEKEEKKSDQCKSHWCTEECALCSHTKRTGAQVLCALVKEEWPVHSHTGAQCALVHTTDWCTVCSVLWCTPQTGAQCALCSGAHHRLVQELVNSVLCALMHTTDWCRDWCTVCSVLWCTPQTSAGTGAHHRLVQGLVHGAT